MKFGETFTEYLQTNQERFVEKCSHVEYKRLKKVLKSCRRCRAMRDFSADNNGEEGESPQYCKYESCPCEYSHSISLSDILYLFFFFYYYFLILDL